MRYPRLLATLLCLLVVPAWASPPEIPPVSPPDSRLPLASAIASQTTSAYRWIPLARQGHFDQLRQQLAQQPKTQNDPLLASLRSNLDRYQSHHQTLLVKRREAYGKAIEAMLQSMRERKFEEALISAIEAQGQAADPKILMRDPRLLELIAQSEEAAGHADLQGDWLTALSLYRAMKILFEPQPRYKTHIDRLTGRVRALALYAPAKIREIYLARAKATGQKDPPPVALGQETWEIRLRDVTLSILTSTLKQAATRHLDGVGYRKLMLGAVNGFMTMLNTPGLEKTFPALNNQAQHLALIQYLQTLEKKLRTHQNAMTHADVAITLQKIFKRNRQTVKLPQTVVIYELTEGATGILDPFSSVIWPYEVDQFNRHTSGQFFGVGIQIAMTNNRLTVVSPLPDTPAWHAGLKPGDIIVKVNGQDTADWTLDWAVKEITGPRDTDVDLIIERTGNKQLLPFRLTRAKIKIQSIRGWQRNPKQPNQWDYHIDRASGIGYIRLSQFIPQTPADFDAAINQLEKRGPFNALILDLRFNPGGLLRKSVELANRFIAKGTIVSTVDGQDITTSQFTARRHLVHRLVPTVVLMNQGSASAAEIVAGALQDHQVAFIVGSRSFGKGSVQDLYSLSGSRAQLKLTTQHYQLPLGRLIHRVEAATAWGVEPDLAIKMTDQEVADAIELRREIDVAHEQDGLDHPTASQILDKGLDLQLEAALLILKTELAANRHAHLPSR